jgi:NTE family protein
MEEILEIRKNKNYEYLVLSGGGVKGICYCGALDVLDSYNILSKLKGIAATSAGAIVAALLAIGYTPTEIKTIISEIDLERIFNDGQCMLSDAYHLAEYWGSCAGNYILEVLGDLISRKTGNPNYTLEDLYNDKNIKLVIVTTNMTFQKSVYLYAGNPIDLYSRIPIRVAVRLSMGIPIIFQPYLYNNNYFVDGGLLDNFPLHVFDGEYPGDYRARLNISKVNPKVLGLKIMPDNEKVNYQESEEQVFGNIGVYFASFINLLLIENDRRIMTDLFWLRTVNIVTDYYAVDKFSVTEEEMKKLIDNGEVYCRKFFGDEKIDN